MVNFIEVDGRQHEAVITTPAGGARNSVAFILLHEGLGCVELWKDFPQQLADQTGSDVVSYSRGGYGKSSPVEVPRRLDYMAEEATVWLPQIMQQLEYDQFILVGHSDGGSIALIFAGTSTDDRVIGVVTLAAHVFNEPVCVASIEKARDAYESGGLRQGLARYHGDNVDCAFWGWNKAWLDPDFLDFNIESYLESIRVPLLVVQGDLDEYGTLDQVDAIVSQAGSRSESLVIPNCRHSIHRDAPEQLIAAIKEFKHSL
ncbi:MULTISPECIES: alpha/beta fold hydrolase [unclassified Marinobacterium]|uniref:alpha/beta fold hydrolase n=1 Tax=unclassified Marinobacterium TaxID=2644139 RepID=UPI001567CC84|nr:Proline iminopeptidase [Marinobacterium sp. xm-a-152]NRP26627.1 Proline iminopeptidase [Marinobacterium sp. xm-d-420]NRP37634.1 Proline iminopeptidase [Marinobacterium sp. xm-a-121]NRP56542.1 Proline iminopeptidase [Marinobacterium sp. xm-d-510]NRP94710.1 Proline iminopeptidase [Marinobacterium sp. xm-g-59]NRP96669.1 Proline iminopeptidase [Marinobacterium sp. xm-a-127]NRP99978.1 Proline iminopeptidase [Marinobacterium sp. xm-v-233]